MQVQRYTSNLLRLCVHRSLDSVEVFYDAGHPSVFVHTLNPSAQAAPAGVNASQVSSLAQQLCEPPACKPAAAAAAQSWQGRQVPAGMFCKGQHLVLSLCCRQVLLLGGNANISGYAAQGSLYSGAGYWSAGPDLPAQLSDMSVRLLLGR